MILWLLLLSLVSGAFASSKASEKYLELVHGVVKKVKALHISSPDDNFKSCGKSFKLFESEKFSSLPEVERLQVKKDLLRQFELKANFRNESPIKSVTNCWAACANFLFGEFCDSLDVMDQVLLEEFISQYLKNALSEASRMNPKTFLTVCSNLRNISFKALPAKIIGEITPAFEDIQNRFDNIIQTDSKNDTSKDPFFITPNFISSFWKQK